MHCTYLCKHEQVLERKYSKDEYVLQTSFAVEFSTAGIITVEIDSGEELDTNWEITALYKPNVSIRICMYHIARNIGGQTIWQFGLQYEHLCVIANFFNLVVQKRTIKPQNSLSHHISGYTVFPFSPNTHHGDCIKVICLNRSGKERLTGSVFSMMPFPSASFHCTVTSHPQFD